MNLLDRYIARTVLAAIGMVVLVISALLVLMLFISEIDDLGDGNYTFTKILIWMGLMLPARIYLVLPVVALLGSLLALGALAAGSELVVIRSAGVSMKRLAVSVSLAGIVMALVTSLLGEYIAPGGVRYATDLRDKARHGEARRSVDDGLWLRQADWTLRVKSTLPGGRIDGLSAYQVNADGQLIEAVTAETAHTDGQKLIVDQPEVTRISITGSEVARPDRMALPIRIAPDVLDLAVTKPEELSSAGLWQYIDYLKANDIDADDYQLALWRNIVTPFTVWALVVFALPFAFGSLRSASAGQRLFVGGLIGLLFFLVNEIIASTGPVYGVAPWLAASLPTVLLVLGTSYWMRRLN